MADVAQLCMPGVCFEGFTRLIVRKHPIGRPDRRPVPEAARGTASSILLKVAETVCCQRLASPGIDFVDEI
jgi:hypothetical protein